MATTDAPLPPYDGPRGILHADRHEVAAKLFVATFLSQRSSPLPRIELEVVGLATLHGQLAELGGYSTSSFTLFATKQPWAITTQLTLECVLIWERASIAARYGDKVVVLEPGMRILVSAEPSAAAQRTIDRVRPASPETSPEQPQDGSKLKGPASYFASIEQNYGRPIQEWLDLVSAQLADHPHMKVVSLLKTEHGMGHGHANAVVAYVRAAQK